MNTADTRAGRIFVTYSGLKQHGVSYCRVHLNRLVRDDLFPAPVQLSPNRVAWILGSPDEPGTIEHWKANRPLVRHREPTDAAA